MSQTKPKNTRNRGKGNGNPRNNRRNPFRFLDPEHIRSLNRLEEPQLRRKAEFMLKLADRHPLVNAAVHELYQFSLAAHAHDHDPENPFAYTSLCEAQAIDEEGEEPTYVIRRGQIIWALRALHFAQAEAYRQRLVREAMDRNWHDLLPGDFDTQFSHTDWDWDLLRRWEAHAAALYDQWEARVSEVDPMVFAKLGKRLEKIEAVRVEREKRNEARKAAAEEAKEEVGDTDDDVEVAAETEAPAEVQAETTETDSVDTDEPVVIATEPVEVGDDEATIPVDVIVADGVTVDA